MKRKEEMDNAEKENAPALFPVPLRRTEGVHLLCRLRTASPLPGSLSE